jgi:hypothetical protein
MMRFLQSSVARNPWLWVVLLIPSIYGGLEMLAVCDAKRAAGTLPPAYFGERAIDFTFGFATYAGALLFITVSSSGLLERIPRPLQPVLVTVALYLIYWVWYFVRGH